MVVKSIRMGMILTIPHPLATTNPEHRFSNYKPHCEVEAELSPGESIEGCACQVKALVKQQISQFRNEIINAAVRGVI